MWTPIAAPKGGFTTNSGRVPLTRAATRMRRSRGTPPNRARKRKGNPRTRTTCATADNCRASSSYVQQIRDAVVNLIWERQKRNLESICHCENAVMGVPLEETELNNSQRKIINCFWRNGRTKKSDHVNTTAPMLVVHCIIQIFGGDGAFSQ